MNEKWLGSLVHKRGIKMKKERKVNISIWIDEKKRDELEKHAQYFKLPRNKLIQNILDTGIEEIKIQKFLGIVQLSMLAKSIKDQWKKGVKNLKNTDDSVSPQRPPRGVNISLGLEPSIISQVEELSEKLNLTRSKLIENMIDMGLTDLKILKRTGLADITVYIVKLKENWKKRFQETQESLEKGELVIKDKNGNL